MEYELLRAPMTPSPSPGPATVHELHGLPNSASLPELFPLPNLMDDTTLTELHGLPMSPTLLDLFPVPNLVADAINRAIEPNPMGILIPNDLENGPTNTAYTNPPLVRPWTPPHLVRTPLPASQSVERVPLAPTRNMLAQLEDDGNPSGDSMYTQLLALRSHIDEVLENAKTFEVAGAAPRLNSASAGTNTATSTPASSRRPDESPRARNASNRNGGLTDLSETAPTLREFLEHEKTAKKPHSSRRMKEVDLDDDADDEDDTEALLHRLRKQFSLLEKCKARGRYAGLQKRQLRQRLAGKPSRMSHFRGIVC